MREEQAIAREINVNRLREEATDISAKAAAYLSQAATLISSSRRLISIIWPFVLMVPLLLLLTVGSLDILSAVRAYVGGEGLYSKAQKDSIFHLNRYAETHDENDYEAFRRTIAVPLGDAKARRELEKAEPDYDVVWQGLLEGRNHPDDIPGLIRLFRYFRHVSYIDRVIAIWAEGDELIEELCGAGELLHRQITTGDHGYEQLRPILNDIHRINVRLTPLEDEFSYTLGEASRITRLLLLNITIAFAVLLLVASTILSRRMLSRNEAFEKAQQLTRLNEILEHRVLERTAELEASNARLGDEIEARKSAEEHIRAALREKVILLGEIHHRVKNNLQIVHSLLDLQMTQIDDAAVRDMLQDSKNRIRSMALIHQTLYQSKNFSQVDFGDILKKLVADISASTGLDSGPVKIQVNALSVLLPMNTAIPCGLIANELITNALKHAFPGGRAGQITVTLEVDEQQCALLSVSDNGVGIPQSVDLAMTQTLGLELVTLLADQLGGELTTQRCNPTLFVVRFPLENVETQKE